MDGPWNRPLPSGTRRFLGQADCKCQSEQGVECPIRPVLRAIWPPLRNLLYPIINFHHENCRPAALVPETAAYYRATNIAAVIFRVDAECETGFRRYNNGEMREAASENLTVLIPI